MNGEGEEEEEESMTGPRCVSSALYHLSSSDLCQQRRDQV